MSHSGTDPRVRSRRTRRTIAAVAATIAVTIGGCTWETAEDAETEPPATTLATTTTSLPRPAADEETDSGDDGPAPPDLDGVVLRLVTVAEEIDRPVDLAYEPGSNDLWIASKGGEITRILARESGNGALRYELDWRPTLDLTDVVNDDGNEQGLLGIAIPRGGRHLFAAYTDDTGALTVDRYEISTTRSTIDDETRKEIIRVEQPFSNHNGGAIRFGPDGYLYIGLGDGGGSGDPSGHGQNTETLLGSILRLEVDTDAAYEIPPGNPFADGDESAPEIFIHGVRNPWRFSFDRDTGDLWIGDVGQDRREEIDRLPAASMAGGELDLGWNHFEGTEPFEGEVSPDGLVEPIHTYGHDEGCSVTGGYRYRGSAIPELAGTYLFADYCAGAIQGLVLDGDDVVEVRSLGIGIVENSLGSFGEGPDGELYVLSLTEGRVLRIESGLDAEGETEGSASGRVPLGQR